MFVERLDFNPDLLSLHAGERQAFPYLLMSSGQTGWDLLLALPMSQQVFGSAESVAFFDALRTLALQEGERSYPLPFVGGWFVYLGYELLSTFEPTVPAREPDDFPLAALARIPAAVLFDRATCTTWLMAETSEQFEALKAHCIDAPFLPRPVQLRSILEDDPAWYLKAITQLKHFIQHGDVFQVNISRAWCASLGEEVRAVDLFAALRKINPAPFSALADFGCAQIISSSPERLVRVHDGWVDTRPIAGTYPRSTDPVEDAILKHTLINNVKERAEHVMLIDLARNDVGRIALPGTVEVNECMAVASYAYVHHIESNIRGRLRPDRRPIDVLRALFPGGTITGCPKVRTMQIIRELEPRARRAYTGSLGYINRDGTMDLNILIRTFMKEGASLRFHAGGGIVADSDPERELLETQHKARGLLRALGLPEIGRDGIH